MKKNKPVLIITGAIDIAKNVPFQTAVVKTTERLSQYIACIEYAIQNYQAIDNIIFAENTGYEYDYSDIYLLAENFNKKLEIFSFIGSTEKILQQGKGYGEGEILRYVLSHSTLYKESASFIKLTGRLTVKNFDSVIESTSEGENYFILQSLFRYFSGDSIATAFFKVNANFFKKYLLEAYKEVDDKNNRMLENIYFEKVKDHSPRYFKYYPLIQGQSGSNGTQHNERGYLEIFKRKFLFRFSSVLQGWFLKKER